MTDFTSKLTGFSPAPLVLFTTLAACAGSQRQAEIPPTPPSETLATLSGPLCDGPRCGCNEDPASAGQAAEGFKRFQIRLGPSQQEFWLTIDKQRFYKSVQRPTECFYVDLAPGRHQFRLWTEGKNGFGGRLAIRELGANGPHWYESFDFSCGAPGLCDSQSFSEWKERVQGISEGKHAPCGSVRISGLEWILGRSPDNLHPENFYLEGVMKVYKFSPKHPPGSEQCAK